MSLQHSALALAAGLLLATSAHAQVGVTADFGTTGAGTHLVFPLASTLNARLGANYLKHDFTTRSGSVNYNVKGKLQSVDMLADWYLRESGSFHLTSGLVYNGSQFDARANPENGVFTLNGRQYSATDVGVLDGKIGFRKIAPYLGIGWGNALAQEKRWNFLVDAGAFYQGKPDVHLASAGCTNSAAVCGAIADDAAAEQARLQQDADSYKVYPVLRASLSYRF